MLHQLPTRVNESEYKDPWERGFTRVFDHRYTTRRVIGKYPLDIHKSLPVKDVKFDDE